MPTVSIIIPVYNELSHVEEVIARVLKAPMPAGAAREVIVVDDGSTDGTTEVLRQMNNTLVQVHHSKENYGKGAAIRYGLENANGDVVMIQDGDQEYNPNELIHLAEPILSGKEKVVYGSRFIGSIDGMIFKYWLVNRLLVFAVWFLYGVRISDEATAYKAFDRKLLQSLDLKCERFEFCPEVTAKVIRRGHHIHEVPISYSARSLIQGKKIRFSDAIQAFWTLIRYRFWK